MRSSLVFIPRSCSSAWRCVCRPGPAGPAFLAMPSTLLHRVGTGARAFADTAEPQGSKFGSEDRDQLPCIVDVMIVPSGVGASHSEQIARAIRCFNDDPALTVATHSMGTCLEGEWDAVMGAVKFVTLELHTAGVGRVTTTLKVSTRTDKQDYSMAYKMQRIQEEIHECSASDSVGALAETNASVDQNVRLQDKVAKTMKLKQVSAAVGLDLNQTKAQLGDPTYDEQDEARWVGMARRAGNMEMTDAVKRGQNKTSEEHFLLLHKAASSGDIAQMRSLLQQPEAREQVSVADESPGGACMTPLHWASKNGHLDVCETLIQAGASVTACDQFGRTALDLAQRYGHDAVASMLMDTSRNY